MKTVKLHITGKVQGVFFRATAKDVALSLGLKGKVWNNPDNSVGAIVQGTESRIIEFIQWCRKGPSRARVEHVAVEEVKKPIQFTKFEISRGE